MKVFWCRGIIYSCAIFLPLSTTTQVSAFTTVVVISNNAMTRNGIARNLKNTLIHHSRSTNSPQNEDNNNIIKNVIETKQDVSTSSSPPPPSFNGKLVLPRKILQQGLKKKGNDENYQIAAVYALLTRQYSKATPGWEHVIRVGMTMDLAKELNQLDDQEDATAAFVRVRSYSIPQRLAMEELVQEWNQFVTGATTETSKTTTTAQPLVDSDELLRRAKVNSLSAFDDDDDDDDDDDEDWQVSLPSTRSSILSSSTSASVMSPFADTTDDAAAVAATTRNLPFTIESVNTVLEEVRPFLIADGGNVAVDRIDDTTQNVYLKLEGACGSCPSSTVTMQMGIERVLRENFPNLGQVLQVTTNDDGKEEVGKPSELTVDMVMLELNRIGPAISAMGGNYELVRIDPSLGLVELKFKGPNKLQQGLELALLDIPLCKYVKFTIYDDNY